MSDATIFSTTAPTLCCNVVLSLGYRCGHALRPTPSLGVPGWVRQKCSTQTFAQLYGEVAPRADAEPRQDRA
eukprot:7838477-Prorocentrum_lima.AAC.1